MIPELNCTNCGSNRFSYPRTMNDDTAVTCQDCGQSAGSLAELKERIASAVLKKPTRAIDST